MPSIAPAASLRFLAHLVDHGVNSSSKSIGNLLLVAVTAAGVRSRLCTCEDASFIRAGASQVDLFPSQDKSRNHTASL